MLPPTNNRIRPRYRAAAAFALVVVAAHWAGCSQAEAPAPNAQPFEAAIAEYLERNNMAMALKEIKEGPIIDDRTATLTASLQHASLSGPAVTWQFHFEQQTDGGWTAVSHRP